MLRFSPRGSAARSAWIALFFLLLPFLAACDRSRREAPISERSAKVPDAPTSLPEQTFPGRDPNLTWDSQGRLHAVYVEEAGGAARVVYRRLDVALSPAVAVSPEGVTTSSHGEVPPLIQALPGGILVVAYAVPLPGQWRNEIHLQRSTDGGRTWSAPRPLPAAGKRGSGNELAATTVPGGPLVLAWLDDRQAGRGLRVLRSPDGVHFEPDLTVDAKTCECCGNALLAGPGGNVWLAYRDADPDHVRDIHVALSRDQGASFGEPQAVSADGWKLNGCPHSGPRLARAEDGALWTAWFTGAEPGIYAAVSRDGGSTFDAREPIASPGDGASVVRHPEIGVLPGGGIVVLYEVVRGAGPPAIEGRLRQPRGPWGPPVTLAAAGSYPRLASRGGKAAVAFTRLRGERTEVVIRDGARLFPRAAGVSDRTL
jgi:hypothetical protein